MASSKRLSLQLQHSCPLLRRISSLSSGPHTLQHACRPARDARHAKGRNPTPKNATTVLFAGTGPHAASRDDLSLSPCLHPCFTLGWPSAEPSAPDVCNSYSSRLRANQPNACDYKMCRMPRDFKPTPRNFLLLCEKKGAGQRRLQEKTASVDCVWVDAVCSSGEAVLTRACSAGSAGWQSAQCLARYARKAIVSNGNRT